MTKVKTNEQRFRALLNDLGPFGAAILRERMMNMVQYNRDAIEKDPESFNNPLFNHTHYSALCDKIEKHLGFEE